MSIKPYIIFLSLILPIIASFIVASYTFLDFNYSELLEKYDYVFFIFAILSIFLFLFIDKSVIIYILFVLSISIFLSQAIYKIIYAYSIRKRINLSRRSSYIYLFIRRKNIVYFVFAVLAMFINVVFISSNYQKLSYSTNYLKYDYVIKTKDTNEILSKIITASKYQYNVINSSEYVILDNEKYELLSLDLTKFESFYNASIFESLDYLPENAIIVPRTIFNEIDHNIGDDVEISINNEIMTFKIYSFIDDVTGTTIYTNKEINSEYKKILIYENGKKSSFQDINKIFNGELKRKMEDNIELYRYSILKFIFASILFILISSFVIILYIRERKEFDDSFERDKNKLIHANLKSQEVQKTTLFSNYLMYFITFSILFILLLSMSYYNSEYINYIFKVNFTYQTFPQYFIYLLEIFLFFTIIIFVDYIIEKGKLDNEI